MATLPAPAPKITTGTYNPYTAKSTNAGVLSSAFKPVANVTATPTASKVEDAKATGYTATGYNAKTGTAATYDAAQATGTNWDVDSQQTVQGQVNGIIAADSPLMQQAATKARQASAGKGLLNSSLAVQAGQAALYEAAMPMAQQDAQTYAERGRYNADVANNMSQFNASATNEAGQFNAGAKNTMTQANMDATNQASQFTAGAKNEASQFGANAQNETSRFNAESQNKATQADADRALDASKTNQATQLEASKTQYQGAIDMAMQNADNATKIELQKIDGKVRESVASIEGEYKLALQSSDAASEQFKQIVTNITNLVTNPDLSSASKERAIDQQILMLREAMNLQAAITDIPGLGNLISNVGSYNPYDGKNQEALKKEAEDKARVDYYKAAGYTYNPLTGWTPPRTTRTVDLSGWN